MKNIYYKTINLLLENPLLTTQIGRLIGIIGIFIYVICSGCSSNPRYVEGTNLSLGAYLPIDGQLMGIELANYLNGCSVRTSSNQSFNVSRTYNATNEWAWGLLTTIEGSETKIQVGSYTNVAQNLK